MDTISLLIADSNEEFACSLSRRLQSTFRTSICHTGKDALRVLLKDTPDILVLDLSISELDGISLLYRAADSGVYPVIFASTPMINPYIIESMQLLKVEYLVLQPCDVHATADRIIDISKRLHRSESYAPDPKTHVSNILSSLGIPAKLRGYTYLRDAILLMVQTPMQSITKELYPSVGDLHDQTAQHVERSIRTAINKAWEHRDDRVWEHYFYGNTVKTGKRPSNAVFIKQLADRLSLDQMEINLP